MKKGKNMRLFVSLLLGIVFLTVMLAAGLPVVSASMNLRITGSVNNYSSDLWLKIKTGASGNFDIYDLKAPASPSEYSQFASSVSGNLLSIDSWDENPRTLNLTYYMSSAQTGDLSFSWNSDSINSDLYNVKLKYFGDDQHYADQVGEDVDMETTSSYSTTISGKSNIYIQINVEDYVAPEITLTSPADEYSVVGEQEITFSFSIFGNLTGLTDCNLELNSESTPITNIEEDNSVTLNVLPGSYSWGVTCEDGSRTISSESRSLEVNEEPPREDDNILATQQISNGIIVAPDFIIVQNVTGGDVRYRSISISNAGDNVEQVNITILGLDGIVIMNESYSSFFLSPEDHLVVVPLTIVAPKSVGVHKGRILVNNFIILVSVDVRSNDLLFDAGVQITKEYSVIPPGGDLRFTTTLIPMGEAGVDVTLNYEIMNEQGLEVFKKSYTKKVDQQEVIPEVFEGLDIPEGKYILSLELLYCTKRECGDNPDAVATSSAGFRVKQGEANGLFALSNFSFILFASLVAIVILVILIIFVAARNKRIRRKIGLKKRIR